MCRIILCSRKYGTCLLPDIMLIVPPYICFPVTFLKGNEIKFVDNITFIFQILMNVMRICISVE